MSSASKKKNLILTDLNLAVGSLSEPYIYVYGTLSMQHLNTLDRLFKGYRRALTSLYLSFNSTTKSFLPPAATRTPYSGHFST